MQHRSTVICLISCCIFSQSSACVCVCLPCTQVMHAAWSLNHPSLRKQIYLAKRWTNLALWLEFNFPISRGPALAGEPVMGFRHRYRRSQCHSCFVTHVRGLWINLCMRQIKKPSSLGGDCQDARSNFLITRRRRRKKKIKPWMKAWKFSLCWYNSQVCL